MINLLYIDLFCGAGGTSTGVEKAKYREEQCAKVIACVNHDANAIASHAANHPEALHFTEDIRTLELTSLIEHINLCRLKYPNALLVLWASLECTNFSKAKGGQPRDADSRTLAEHLFRYIESLNPDYIQIENVEEFMSWGDMDENGKPISMDKGSLYRRWINNVKTYGYKFNHRILNAADYGAYTSRKRFFGIFARPNLPIIFPEPTHAKSPKSTLFGALKKWKPVRDVLDFFDEGISIFGRKKPLSEKTLARIYAGLIKFIAGGKVKFQERLDFIIKYYSGNPEQMIASTDEPAPTLRTKDSQAIIVPEFLSAYYGNGDNVHSIETPSPTVTTKDRLSVVQPKFMCSYNFKDAGKSINEPCPTLLTKDRLSLVTPFFMNNFSGGGQHSDIGNPCPAITTVPKQNLVSCQFIDQQYGQSKPASAGKPLGAITTNPKYNLVNCEPWIMNTNFNNVGSTIDMPAQVITANRKHHYLMNPQFRSTGGDVENPCFTLIARMDKMPPYLVCSESGDIAIEVYETDSPMTKKIKEFMAIYGIIDIKMRMLKIKELKRIMGFPEDYILIGTKADQKKFIGNAVEVNMARVLCEALSKELNREENITGLKNWELNSKLLLLEN